MRNRTTAFGYQYLQGKLTINPCEANTLNRIFSCYLKGMSLLNIAEMLNAEKVEYSPGVVGWNKSRLMRILENRKYLGDEKHPPLIEAEIYEKVQNIKLSKNTQKQTDRNADIFQINLPVICESCGTKMRRRHDSRYECKQRWICQNTHCRNIVNISDEEFLSKVTDCLNIVIQNQSIIDKEISPKDIQRDESRKIEDEITKQIDSLKFDKKAIKAKVMKLVSIKYKEIDPTPYTIKQLKGYFKNTSHLKSFSAKLCMHTVKSIRLGTRKNIEIILINDQVIRKEKNND